MIISELIIKLERLKAIEGDIPIALFDVIDRDRYICDDIYTFLADYEDGTTLVGISAMNPTDLGFSPLKIIK